jgi:ABC-type transport system substrate-binding protein
MRIAMILATILRLILPFSMQAQAGTVNFTANTTKPDFPNTMTFHVAVSADTKIQEVQLLYGVEQDTCGTVQAIAYPDITPGNNVETSWEWDMRQSGSIPPGAQIWWQWKAIDASGNATLSDKQTVTWLDNIHNWTVQEQDKIRVHAYSMTASQMTDLVTTAVKALQDLGAETGMQASNMIDLYIYANTDDMKEAILYEPQWTGGLAYPEYNIVLIGISNDQFEWGKQTEAHELTHILVGDYTFSCLGSIPTWLNEGLAKYGEGGPEQVGKDQFNQAVKDDTLLAFKTLSGGFSEDSDKANLSYTQSYYMVKYLLDNYGQDKLNQLLTALSKGNDEDVALKDTYNFDLSGFETEWRKSLHAKALAVENPTATPQPTQIPTIQPVSISASSSGSASTPEPSAGQPHAGVATGTPPATTAGSTKTPFNGKDLTSLQKSILFIVLGGTCLVGIILVALLTFFIAKAAGKKKNTLTLAVIILITSGWMAMSTKPVNGQSNSTTPVPPLPTATAFVPPEDGSGVYTNPDAGVKLKFPAQVRVTDRDLGNGLFAKLEIGDREVFGLLFASDYDSTKSLEENGKTIREDNFNDLESISIVEEKQIQLNDGEDAWYTLANATLPVQGSPQDIQIGLVTVKGNFSAVSVEMYTMPENYHYYKKQIEQVYYSLQTVSPSISGFSRDQVLLLEGGESSNPRENDPATSHSSGDTLVFSGLVQNDPQLKLTPDLAASWDISPDGTVYTFHLEPKAVFHNGRPVTADDVVYSWERAAAKATNSDTVITYLGDVVGVKEMHEGMADHISGLKVIDDHTLQVTIDAPKPYFLLKLTYPTSFVLDKENIAQGDKWYYTPNGTGPYRLARWESMKQKIYERFDDFYGPKPKIQAIVESLYTGDSTRLYESGSIDLTGIGSYSVDRFTDPSEPMHTELHSTVSLCTSYITLDVTQPPFDDVKVRQAFALAIDKQKYIQVVLNNVALPAHGLYPPALPGYNAKLEGWNYDPQKAVQLLGESKYAGNMPEITFSTSGYGSSVSSDVSAWIQMWEQTLGVKINVENIEPEKYMDIIADGKHGQLISNGWCADYPDPQNFADVLFHSGADMNNGHYSNPELDSLLDRAGVETDVNKRIQMYQQAEQIIVNDVPAIFVDHGISYTLVKPYVQGYVVTPMSIPIERYLSIDMSKVK